VKPVGPTVIVNGAVGSGRRVVRHHRAGSQRFLGRRVSQCDAIHRQVAGRRRTKQDRITAEANLDRRLDALEVGPDLADEAATPCQADLGPRIRDCEVGGDAELASLGRQLQAVTEGNRGVAAGVERVGTGEVRAHW
jgi:hypothetical protein